MPRAVPLTHAKKVPPSPSPKEPTSVVAIGPPSLSRIHPLVWSAALADLFCKSLQDRTWHVQPIGPQLAPSSFRRSIASNEHWPVRIGPAVHAAEAKMLGLTSGQTNIGRPTFSSGSPRGNLLAKASNAKAFKPFYSAILKKGNPLISPRDGRSTTMQQHNSCSVIGVIFPANLSVPMSGANEGTRPLSMMADLLTCCNRILAL